MSGTDQSSPVEVPDFSRRLEFLYKIVEDTQNTIRFIDTKAAFCLTLLLGMVATALQIPHTSLDPLHRVLFSGFMIVIGVTLLICLRVVFPINKQHGLELEARVPHFFIGENQRRQRFLRKGDNKFDNVLSETFSSYLVKVGDASDSDLLSSMCDEVVMISLIRQIKNDRLRGAVSGVACALLLLVAYVAM
jgi:hypothetical protein